MQRASTSKDINYFKCTTSFHRQRYSSIQVFTQSSMESKERKLKLPEIKVRTATLQSFQDDESMSLPSRERQLSMSPEKNA